MGIRSWVRSKFKKKVKPSSPSEKLPQSTLSTPTPTATSSSSGGGSSGGGSSGGGSSGGGSSGGGGTSQVTQLTSKYKLDTNKLNKLTSTPSTSVKSSIASPGGGGTSQVTQLTSKYKLTPPSSFTPPTPTSSASANLSGVEKYIYSGVGSVAKKVEPYYASAALGAGFVGYMGSNLLTGTKNIAVKGAGVVGAGVTSLSQTRFNPVVNAPLALVGAVASNPIASYSAGYSAVNEPLSSQITSGLGYLGEKFGKNRRDVASGFTTLIGDSPILQIPKSILPHTSKTSKEFIEGSIVGGITAVENDPAKVAGMTALGFGLPFGSAALGIGGGSSLIGTSLIGTGVKIGGAGLYGASIVSRVAKTEGGAFEMGETFGGIVTTELLPLGFGGFAGSLAGKYTFGKIDVTKPIRKVNPESTFNKEVFDVSLPDGKKLRVSTVEVKQEIKPPRVSYQTTRLKEKLGVKPKFDELTYLPPETAIHYTPDPIFNDEPFILFRKKPSKKYVDVFEIKAQGSLKRDLGNIQQLPTSEQYTWEGLAEYKTGGTPVARSQVKNIIGGDKTFVSEVEQTKLGRLFKPKKDLSFDVTVIKNPTTSSSLSASETKLLRSTPTQDIYFSEIASKDVSSGALSIAKGKRNIMTGTTRVLKEPKPLEDFLNLFSKDKSFKVFGGGKSSEFTSFAGTGKVTKSGLTKVFGGGKSSEFTSFAGTGKVTKSGLTLSNNQIQNLAPKFSLPKPKPTPTTLLTPKPIKIDLGLGLKTKSAYEGLGMYERTGGNEILNVKNINRNAPLISFPKLNTNVSPNNVSPNIDLLSGGRDRIKPKTLDIVGGRGGIKLGSNTISTQIIGIKPRVKPKQNIIPVTILNTDQIQIPISKITEIPQTITPSPTPFKFNYPFGESPRIIKPFPISLPSGGRKIKKKSVKSKRKLGRTPSFAALYLGIKGKKSKRRDKLERTGLVLRPIESGAKSEFIEIKPLKIKGMKI